MVVPNYVPDPVEIPGNVTEMPYRVRLGMIRRVSALHLCSVAAVLLVAWLGPNADMRFSAAIAGACLVVLSLVRLLLRGSRLEWVISAGMLPVLLLSLGLLVGELSRQGHPVWAPGVGLVFSFIYSALCGRDFSFLGQWSLSLIASSLAIIGLLRHMGLQSALQQALLLNGIYLTYFVYDLASLLSRRRIGEELGAVADLYRDVLNFLGYAVRVLQHWRKHRIWAAR